MMPIRLHGTTQLPLRGFSWHFILGTFIKISRANLHESLVKTGQTYGALYVRTEVCNKTFCVVDSDVCRTHCCVSMTTFLILSLVSRQIFKIALPYDRVKDNQNPNIPQCYVIRTIPILSVFLISFPPYDEVWKM